MKPNKQIYVDFILDELDKGNVHYEDVCTLFCPKFQLKRRTFSKYWKIANKAYYEKSKRIKAKQEEEEAALRLKAKEKDVLSKIEAQIILSKIAKGVAKKVGDKIIVPTPNEQRLAIETLGKMEVWFPPSKTTIDGGIDIRQITGMEIVNVSDEDKI